MQRLESVDRAGGVEELAGRRAFDGEGEGSPAELGLAVFILAYVGMCASMLIRFVVQPWSAVDRASWRHHPAGLLCTCLLAAEKGVRV